MKGYYDSIHKGNKPVLGRKQRAKKIGLNHLNGVESPENSKEGAAFLAVFRGKVHNYILFTSEKGILAMICVAFHFNVFILACMPVLMPVIT